MLGKIFSRFGRAVLIAFGGWALLSVLLIAGTVGSLMEAEHTEMQAVLAHAEAGATAVEQTVLRLFDAVKTIQGLAQTRLLLAKNGDEAGRRAIDQEMHDIVATHRFGVQDVSVILDGQLAWTSITPGLSGPGPSETTNGAMPKAEQSAEAAEDLAAADAPQVGAPVYDALNKRWSVQTSWGLRDTGGNLVGQLVVWLDPIALSDAIRAQTSGEGVVSMVQRRSDGAFLARSSSPIRAMQERPSRSDPAFLMALRTGSGYLQDHAGGVDRLVGFRAPDQVPIVVSQSLDTQVELADFFRLRRIVLAVMLALVAGAFTATRLILANYLLRERLSEQAMLDPLTGLFNRRFFTDVMARRFELARHEGLSAAVLLIDLDGFKQINDTRGHPVGDALLTQVATRLRLCCGPDDLVMRLGGDEFAVVRLCRQQRRDATSLALIRRW
jgi:hypothetical protein